MEDPRTDRIAPLAVVLGGLLLRPIDFRLALIVPLQAVAPLPIVAAKNQFKDRPKPELSFLMP